MSALEHAYPIDWDVDVRIPRSEGDQPLTVLSVGERHCFGCLEVLPPGEIAFMVRVADAEQHYCFRCVTQVYEAMKAAQS